MIRTIWVAIGCLLLLTACSDNKKKTLTESAINAKVDSIVGAKMEELSKQAMEDLDRRMSIEVKAKADSIVAAKTGKLDTTKKKVTTVTPQKPFKPVLFKK